MPGHPTQPPTPPPNPLGQLFPPQILSAGGVSGVPGNPTLSGGGAAGGGQIDFQALMEMLTGLFPSEIPGAGQELADIDTSFQGLESNILSSLRSRGVGGGGAIANAERARVERERQGARSRVNERQQRQQFDYQFDVGDRLFQFASLIGQNQPPQVARRDPFRAAGNMPQGIGSRGSSIGGGGNI